MSVIQFNNQGKNVGKMEVKNQTETTAELNIFGDIVSDDWGKWCNDDTCPSDISDFLKSLDGVEEINLHINSGGGSVFGGIAIYNMLKQHKAKITTHIDGIAASIASVIACAGDKIIMPANGTFMVHKPSNFYFGGMNADELRKDAEVLDACQKAILQSYMGKVKDDVTEEQIDKLINDETWLIGGDVADYFDFEIEESVQAVACTSGYFGRYKNAPKDLVADDADEAVAEGIDIDKLADDITKKVITSLEAKDKEERETIKQDILNGLDQYGQA